jgi:hypothetical protein
MKTWKEKIIDALTGRNNRGDPLWYSHKKILELVSENEGHDVSQPYRSLSNYLLELVKSGHLERALTPPGVSNKKCHGMEPGKAYLYRRTSKPFKRGYLNLKSSRNQYNSEVHIRGQEAFELWRKHKSLPKWFRRMMMD